MLTQYLVGLCCVHRNPDAVNVILGDMVEDTAAEEKRDVDVTVTLKDAEGVGTLKAFEVKREKRPLDVTTVEQICVKLKDMPSVTHRGIVSTSGYSEPAKTKAAAHGTELYEVKPWLLPMGAQFESFDGFKEPDEFFSAFYSCLLCWVGERLQIIAPDAGGNFTVQHDQQILKSDGTNHKIFGSWGAFSKKLLFRSTEVLFGIEPATTVRETFPLRSIEGDVEWMCSPSWRHSHTLDVQNDKVFLRVNDKLAQVTTVTITGALQWQRRKRVPEFHLIENLSTSKPFAGAVIADMGMDGALLALILSPDTRNIKFQNIKLAEKHKNAIRNLRLK